MAPPERMRNHRSMPWDATGTSQSNLKAHVHWGAPTSIGPAPTPPQRHIGHPHDLPGMPHPGNSPEHWLVGTKDTMGSQICTRCGT
jgi:hypothetical protein